MEDEDRKERLKTSAHELDMLIKMFQRETGRMPGLADILMMREAIASVAMSKDEEIGTYSVDTVQASEGGAYTAHHPPGQVPPDSPVPTFTEAEVKEAQRKAYARGRADEREGHADVNPYG
jgi:hypothetical protein